MKAIILAGGEGTRLRPVSCGCPKPMVRIFDRPVLEYTVARLRDAGFTELCMTLKYLPEQIRSHFGDGRGFGVSIQYRTEAEPLGTAGAVRACADFLGNEDFLVVSGDAVFDLDLAAVTERLRSSGVEAVLALTHCPAPTEYGLVITDADGRVRGFEEKPAWERVTTDLVNTGIYALSPAALNSIPEGRSDFARDIFPHMTLRGALFGLCCEGYWCDIGNPAALLGCTLDALDGKFKLVPMPPELLPGVYGYTSPPENANVTVTPPVYIGRAVSFGADCKIGPRAAIGGGTRIGAGAVLRESITVGCEFGRGCIADGAIVLDNASVGDGCELMRGSVVGAGAVVGENCRLDERAMLWSGLHLGTGAVLRRSLTDSSASSPPVFSAAGELTGRITPENAYSVGLALAERGNAVLGRTGGEAARVAVQALICGLNAAGCSAVLTDAGSLPELGFIGETGGFSTAVLAEQYGDELSLIILGADGSPLDRETERGVERALSGAERGEWDIRACGELRRIDGTAELYTAAAVRNALTERRPEGFEICVSGMGECNRALRGALRRLGCELRDSVGVPCFGLDRRGHLALLRDENGRELDTEYLTAGLTLLETERGRGIACPAAAPAVLERIAGDGEILRVGRDAGAERRLRRLRWMRDDCFGVCRLVCGLYERSMRLSELAERLPDFARVTQELEINADRAALMRRFAETAPEFAADLMGGLGCTTEHGHAVLAPSRREGVMTLRAEAADRASAEAICDELHRRLSELK